MFKLWNKFSEKKKNTFFKTLECHFLVEITTIKSAKFSYKIDLWKVNVKTNRIGSKKQNYHKNRSFATNYLIFLKIQFHYKNLL